MRLAHEPGFDFWMVTFFSFFGGSLGTQIKGTL